MANLFPPSFSLLLHQCCSVGSLKDLELFAEVITIISIGPHIHHHSNDHNNQKVIKISINNLANSFFCPRGALKVSKSADSCCHLLTSFPLSLFSYKDHKMNTTNKAGFSKMSLNRHKRILDTRL